MDRPKAHPRGVRGDEAQKLWHVTVRRAGILSAPSIPPAENPIELDVGPDPGGGPVLAYVRCTDACRVVV